jgi:hypothetical protein
MFVAREIPSKRVILRGTENGRIWVGSGTECSRATISVSGLGLGSVTGCLGTMCSGTVIFGSAGVFVGCCCGGEVVFSGSGSGFCC